MLSTLIMVFIFKNHLQKFIMVEGQNFTPCTPPPIPKYKQAFT